MAENYLPGYEFKVRIGLFVTLNFSKITNLSTEVEYESIGDGGNNDKMRFYNKPKRKPDTIIFERGINTGISNTLYSLVIEGLKVSSVMIEVMLNGSMEKIFWIDEAMITKRSFTDLDASKSSVLIRRLEMIHTGLVEIEV
ncbi:phage tail protein [Lachnospiraceae bacterium ZAX-1]